MLHPRALNNPFVLLATGLGSGFAPIAPGTVGSLLALPIWWFWLVDLPVWQQLAFVVAAADAGYDRSFELLEERDARRADDWRPGTAIELDPRNGRARLEPGTSVDLGGIGKGYAAGRALDAMLVTGSLAGGLVDLGGDIAVRGQSPEGGPWLVAVADPRRTGETLAVLALDGGGVATSGRDARRFGPAGSLHHLIDPETGESSLGGPLTVTVVAPDPVAAEVNATTLAIAGLGEAGAHVAARPGISALYVPHTGPAVPLGRLPLASERLVVRAA
jgi:thiamine biosynthesis lipoprotein